MFRYLTVSGLSVTFSLILIPLINQHAHAAESGMAYAFDENDWPWWRGPNRDGIANPNQTPPLEWDVEKNVRWKQAIPGRGHGSATVVGDRVFLTAADVKHDAQWVFCFNRNSGNLKWQTKVHEGGVEKGGNKKASQASTTVACDGHRLYVSFLNRNAIYATCLDLDGNEIWERKICDYIVHQGYGSSPAIYKHLVILTADNKGGGAIAGLNRQTGEIEWRRDRPKKPNYPSPIIFNLFGRDQLLMTGCDLVSSFDPLTGKTFWEHEGATTECVTSTVTDGKHFITSGGYPKNHMSAVLADGSGKVVWENGERVYVPSMLIKDGFIYGVLDAGVAGCWDAATGEERWKKRLGGVFSSSPVLVGDKIYATNEVGKTFVYSANPQYFKLIAENQLGDDVLATPVFSRGQIFARVAHFDGDERKEVLYCLGEK